MHPIYSQDWSIAVNTGIKCNANGIAKSAGVRYISSPFDNMDSVEGFAAAGEALAQRFNGYWAREKWKLRTQYHRNGWIQAKIAWNEDFPDLYYPHFYAGWFPGTGITTEDIEAWTKDPDGQLDFVWSGLSERFRVRGERLIQILDAGNKVLFLRIEEPVSMYRLRDRDIAEEGRRFCRHIEAAYPDLDFAVLYFFCEEAGRPAAVSEGRICFEPIPAGCDDKIHVADRLKTLRLRPIKELVGNDVSAVPA
jgi:hypothetical protein